MSQEPGGASASAQTNADPSDTLGRASALLFWAQIIGNAGIFVALLLLSRALGPSGRGTFAFITVTAMVVVRVARLGVTESTAVFAAQRPASRPALLSNVVLFASVASLVGAVLVCGGLFLLGDARPAGVEGAELAIMAVGMLATALGDAGYTFLLGCSRFRMHALITATTAWLYALLVAGVWVGFGLTITSAALVWAGSQGIKAVLLLAVSARQAGLAEPDRMLLRESIHFGLRAWVGSLSDFLNERTDQILIALIASEATLGIYAVAVNASEMLLYLPAATATAIIPLVARSDPDLRVERTLRAFRSAMLVTVVSVAIAALVGPPLLPLVFGESFEASVTPFLLLLPGALGFTALAVFSNALVASLYPGLSSIGPFTALVLGLVLDLVLIPRYGASGASAAAAAAFLAGGATAMGLYRFCVGFRWSSLVVPQRGDLEVLRGLAGPLGRRPKPSGNAS